MKITVDRPTAPVFHPITVVLETRAEAATLMAALAVAPAVDVSAEAGKRLFGATDTCSAALVGLHYAQYQQLCGAYDLATRSA